MARIQTQTHEIGRVTSKQPGKFLYLQLARRLVKILYTNAHSSLLAPRHQLIKGPKNLSIEHFPICRIPPEYLIGQIQMQNHLFGSHGRCQFDPVLDQMDAGLTIGFQFRGEILTVVSRNPPPLPMPVTAFTGM